MNHSHEVKAPSRLTPEQRRLRAQIAANARWSREDPTAQATRGQAGLLAKFEREVDPDGTLTPAERTRRAECARKAHMARLALASSKAPLAQVPWRRNLMSKDDTPAERAVDDPLVLARAARIVRAALARQRLTLGDSGDNPSLPAPPAQDGMTSANVANPDRN